MRSPLETLLAAALLLTTASGGAQEKPSPAELTVAAAADLSAALKEIGDGYEKKTGVKVKLSFGASGALTQQIQNGAPFDLFFSADMDYPRQLITAGDAEGASLYQYAVGKLVLWVPADSSLDLDRGMNILVDPAVKKIAIANPQHAPYGRAAEAALHNMGLYEHVAGKLVMGENISQTFQFVQSGAADAGIVALSLAVAPNVRGQGRYWEIPENQYPKIEQGGAILKNSAAAREFRDWLLGQSGRTLLAQYGFSLPGE